MVMRKIFYAIRVILPVLECIVLISMCITRLPFAAIRLVVGSILPIPVIRIRGSWVCTSAAVFAIVGKAVVLVCPCWLTGMPMRMCRGIRVEALGNVRTIVAVASFNGRVNTWSSCTWCTLLATWGVESFTLGSTCSSSVRTFVDEVFLFCCHVCG